VGVVEEARIGHIKSKAMKTKNVAGYIRVSTAGQVDGESLDNQRNQIKAFVKQKGWNLVEIYADEGKSGAKIEHRTQLQRMIKDGKAGKFEIIVFYKLSRFARNAREYQDLEHDLSQHGVSLSSVKEGIDPTTQTGRLIAGILALFAEWEHETIKEQMYENKMASWKAHKSFNGKPPFGYYWDKEAKKLKVNDEEAKIYRRIVSLYVNQRMSYKDITIRFNEEGVKGKSSRWNSATIGNILKNPAYYGHYVVNRVVYEDSHRGAGTKRTKKKKPESEHITFPIPALISKVEWDEIQKIVEFRKVRSKWGGEETDKFYLRDVCVCGRCGGKLGHHYGSKRKDGTHPRYYRCYWAGTSKKSLEAGRQERCTLPAIKAGDVESAVWSNLLMYFALNPQKAFAELLNPERNDERILELKKAVTQKESELKSIERERNNLFKLTQYEGADTDEIHQKLHANKDRLLTVQSTLSKLEGNLSSLEEVKNKEEKFFEYLSRNKAHFKALREDINRLDMKDRKLLIESMLVGKVVVDYDETEPGGPTVDCKMRINPDIFQRFIEEGKIRELDKNSSDHSAAFYFARSLGNDQDSFSCRAH